jgi:hypothetical protein
MESMSYSTLRPAEVCKTLIAALEASEGRRRRRKRDQTPDAIGLAIRRELLERAVQDDPSADAFEGWLLTYSLSSNGSASLGPVAAMARTVLEEWRLAHHMSEFKVWLERGAPSEDADDKSDKPGRSEFE